MPETASSHSRQTRANLIGQMDPAYSTSCLSYTTLLVCALSQIVFGSLYAFSSLADGLRDVALGHTIPLSIMGVAGNTGTFILGAIPGSIADRYSSSKTVMYGTVLATVGWMALWGVVELARANHSGSLNVSNGLLDSLALISLLIIGQGSVGGFLGSWIAAGKLFSKQRRGLVAGILLGGYSLSAGFCALLFKSMLNGSVRWYCITLAVMGAVMGSAATALLTLSMNKYNIETEHRRMEKDMEDTDENHGERQADAKDTNERSNFVPSITSRFWFVKDKKFWGLYTSIFLTLGAALMYVNSASKMSESLEGSEESNSDAEATTERLVLTFSVFNAVSRLIIGYVSDNVAAKGYPRPVLFIIPGATIIIACLTAVFAGKTALIAVSIFVGIAEGSCFALWPVVTRKWFGGNESVSSSGVSFAVMNTAIGFGSLAFNGIFALVYSAHEHKTDDNIQTCDGSQCYSLSFIIATVVNFVGLGLIWFLVDWDRREQGYEHVDKENE